MLIPKKSLGQNFLIDKNICKKISKISKVYNKNILEIGPGMGAITDEIIKLKPKKLILIEKDIDLFKKLRIKYKKIKNIKIINKDILDFNFNNKKIDKIFSNLPYNISVKFIINFLIKKTIVDELILMIQKEVAEKIDSNKNKKNNKIRFFVEATTNFLFLFNIPKYLFYPKPKVNSSIISLKPIKNLNYDKKKLYKFTQKIFLHKRKKIHNIFKKKLIKNTYIKNLINMRAEDLTTKEILYLFKKF